MRRAKKTVIDGITFPSKIHAETYIQLKTLQESGQIYELKLEVPFPLEANGIKIGKYTADFTHKRIVDDKLIVTEAKGYATDIYKLRIKVFKALYPDLPFVEVGRKGKNKKRSRE